MAKYANSGEMRTRLQFMRMSRTVDNDGNAQDTPVNVFGEGVYVYAKWVNAMSGNEAIKEEWINQELLARNPATATCRYSPLLLDETLLIYLEGDPIPYEIISVENVNQLNTWIEIKARRRVAGR